MNRVSTDIISGFSKLGIALSSIPFEIYEEASLRNPWFTPEFIKLAGYNWSEALQAEKIQKWLQDEKTENTDKTCGIIMAGNIPMVGLHDLLCVLAKGMKASVKLSSNDEVLMKYAIGVLSDALPGIQDRIKIDGKLNKVDYLLASGSNNSARYFEYYFRGIPSLIRKNRTSAAILNGKETDQTLALLANDIFTYFGMGCRNVSHLLLPPDMDLKRLYEAFDLYMHLVNHHKYYNNYMYHKSILLMNLDKHYDNGFMLFQEKQDVNAPIATLNYHYYTKMDEAAAYLTKNREQLQCVVSEMKEFTTAIPFGNTQKPELLDYADNMNVMDFLDGKGSFSSH